MLDSNKKSKLSDEPQVAVSTTSKNLAGVTSLNNTNLITFNYSLTLI